MKITFKKAAPKGYKKADLSEAKNLRQFILACRKAVADAKKEKVKRIAVILRNLPKPAALGVDRKECVEIIVREMLLADYEYTKYLSKPKDGWNFIAEVALIGELSKEEKELVERARVVAGEVNAARELANTPGGEMTPYKLAEATREAIRGVAPKEILKVKVLGRKEMEKEGMGAVLGVAKGSPQEPQFIVMEYWGMGTKGSPSGERRTALRDDERPVVLVGKGVTFDTGGLNIKTENFMYTMHMDMSGGAAVLHALVLAAKLGIKKNIVALVPAVENMPGGESYRPGDVLKSLSGKTIEILNTDAEGRVILADALTYAKRYNPRLVVDVATLTGAIMVALGARASGIFSRDEKLIALTRELGEKAGDYVWPMPLWEEYEQEVKGTFGDVANLGKSGRYGGAIAGAVFLLQFAKDYPKDCPWLHIDMAGTMLPADDEHLAKGAKGSPIKLLLSLLENY